MVSLWLWYVLLFTITVVTVMYHWKRRRLYFLANSLNGPPAYPIIGNALLFLCREEDLFHRMLVVLERYSSPIRFWLGPKLVVAIKTASEVEHILSSSKANNKDDVYRFLKVFNGLSLFTTNGSMWKKQRRYLTPFLGSKYMETYFNIINEASRFLVTKLEQEVDKESFDAQLYLNRCYNDIVTEVLIGFKMNAQSGKMDEFLEVVHRMYVLVHSRMLKLWLHSDFIFRLSSNGKEQMRGRDTIHEFLRQGIKESRRASSRSMRTDSILEKLINSQNKHPELYSDQNVFDHIVTLFSASEDTVTSICSYLMVLLGMYPNIQDKLVAEIKTIVDGNATEVQYKDLVELKYLDMCIKETMRLFPIGPFILRKLEDDYHLDDRLLHKGCTIILSFYSVHRDPAHWEKPNDFYPEHFLPETAAKRHPYAFLPFSAGPRSCPGRLFSYVAIKTVVATVLQNFIVEADGTVQDMKLTADISIRPVEGYKIRIKKRIY